MPSNPRPTSPTTACRNLLRRSSSSVVCLIGSLVVGNLFCAQAEAGLIVSLEQAAANSMSQGASGAASTERVAALTFDRGHDYDPLSGAGTSSSSTNAGGSPALVLAVNVLPARDLVARLWAKVSLLIQPPPIFDRLRPPRSQA